MGTALATGGLDPSFGTNGVATITYTDLGGGHPITATPDGFIVGIVGGSPEQRLYRAFPDGSVDTSFGIDGFVDLPVTYRFYPTADQFWQVSVTGDGRFLLNGAGGDGGWLLRRLLADGSADVTFGVGGDLRLGHAPSYYDSGPALSLQADGKIVLTGRRGSDARITRLDADGSPDTSFGSGGDTLIDYGGPFDSFGASRIQSDGKILTSINSTFGSASGAFALARFNDDGSPDTGFGGGDGYFYFRYGTGSSTFGFAVLPDGKILMTGNSAYDIPQRSFLVFRFLPDGTLDPSFGTGGISLHDFSAEDDTAENVIPLPSGKFLVVGQVDPPGPSSVQVSVARYEADGSIDATYGTGGVSIASVDIFSQVLSSFLLPDGDLLVSGSSFPVEGVQNFLMRFTPCGPCDVLQASGGCATAPLAGCTRTIHGGAARLGIKNAQADVADRLTFQWKQGGPTSSSDFGNPSVGTRMAFCVYTGFSADPVPLSRAFIPAGGTCGGAPCWTPLGAGAVGGWKRTDRAGSGDGITRVTLKPGAAGRSKVKLQAKGVRLRMPAMPLPSGVRARLTSETGACWEGDLSLVVKNTPTDWKGVGD